jgi:hypothetical protein
MGSLQKSVIRTSWRKGICSKRTELEVVLFLELDRLVGFEAGRREECALAKAQGTVLAACRLYSKKILSTMGQIRPGRLGLDCWGLQTG